MVSNLGLKISCVSMLRRPDSASSFIQSIALCSKSNLLRDTNGNVRADVQPMSFLSDRLIHQNSTIS